MADTVNQVFEATDTDLKSGGHCDETAKWKAISLTHVEYIRGTTSLFLLFRKLYFCFTQKYATKSQMKRKMWN